MIWEDYEKYLINDQRTTDLLNKVPKISETEVPNDYKSLWKEISYDVQVDKANRHNLTDEERDICLSGLIKRPYHLVNIARNFNVKNIAEVGTAEGLQFYSFAKYAKEAGGMVWSCDIRDIRNTKYVTDYEQVTTFCPGTSSDLASSISDEIDMFFIDADHRRGSVMRDVANLRRHQHDNTIWIFDDFDLRFGCYHDIMTLCKMNKRFKIYRVGDAASGNPNHQVIIFGRL